MRDKIRGKNGYKFEANFRTIFFQKPHTKKLP